MDADAYVDASKPAQNFGTRSVLRVKTSPVVDTYMRFVVPEGPELTSATLKVRSKKARAGRFEVYVAPDSGWDERRITYRNAPGHDRHLATSGRPSRGSSWYEVDVTDAFRTPGPVTLVIRSAGDAQLQLFSRESKAPPVLRVDRAADTSSTTAVPTTAAETTTTAGIPTVSEATTTTTAGIPSVWEATTTTAESTTTTATTARPTTTTTTTTAPPTTTTTAPPTTTTSSGPSNRPHPPADNTTDDSGGRFRVSCDFSHRAQVDPIVAPFRSSQHMHDFFGNTITSDDPSYSRMLSGGSSCGLSVDTAAYWFPSLRAPNGSFVTPDEFLFYYRARPVGYEHGTNYFPPDFKMIAGGVNAPDTAAYWTCAGESDTGYSDRKTFIPDCTGVEEEQLVAHVFFPSCWDGVNLDSADHRSHVAYGLDDGDVASTDPDTCPASHPYKLPQLDLRVVYPITDGTGYVLADGTQLPHADFWNTWQQSALEDLIDDCLRSGDNCGGVSD